MGSLLNVRFQPTGAGSRLGQVARYDRLFAQRSREGGDSTGAGAGIFGEAERNGPMIRITERLSLSDDEIVERMARASGPGGQHVNKTSTAIELRFDVGASSLPEDAKARLRGLAGSRLNQEDVIVLFAQGSRSLEMNRQEARARLADLVRQALHRPKARRPTKPTYSSKLKRLESKTRRGGVKAMRGRPGQDG
jgi:ribosome-associated protein